MSIRNFIERILLVFIGSVIFIILIVHLPSERIVFQSEITNPALGNYYLEVNLPKSGLVGKPEKISLQIIPIDSEDNSKIIDPNSIINLGVDLIVTGGIINPQGLMFTPVIQNKIVKLEWDLIPEDYLLLPGAVHVSIISTNENATSPENRELLFSKEFSININKYLGLSFPKIKRILFGALFVIIILLFGIKLKSKVN